MPKGTGSQITLFSTEQLEELKKRYEAGESSHKLARIYGIHSTTVISYLRQLGATIRPAKRPFSLSKEKMEELEAIKTKGLTWEDLGELYNVNDKTLRSAYYRHRKSLLTNGQ